MHNDVVMHVSYLGTPASGRRPQSVGYVRPMSLFGPFTFKRNSAAVSGNSSAAEFELRIKSPREFQRRSSAAFQPFITRMIATIKTIEEGIQIMYPPTVSSTREPSLPL
ncbi:hypothetical protein GCM10011324_39460 [Allosediminivita pacifica]|nr:hypothetical protein GCM10011324_39460 [Allosediminivita pacifica]